MNDVTIQDGVLVWEPPPIVKPEFRLYYDDKGNVLFYTCEKPEGKYLVVDAATFAAGRPDIKIINGKISTANPGSIVSKLIEADEGIECAFEDVSILVDESYTETKLKWKLVTYEL